MTLTLSSTLSRSHESQDIDRASDSQLSPPFRGESVRARVSLRAEVTPSSVLAGFKNPARTPPASIPRCPVCGGPAWIISRRCLKGCTIPSKGI